MSKRLWENNRDKSNGHKTNILKHSELLIMAKTKWYKGIFESFSLCSKEIYLFLKIYFLNVVMSRELIR